MTGSAKARSTRADVARLASVSPAVVSYVINGGPRPVSAKTKARVERAIAALDYRPNETARALVRGRSHQVGLVVTDTTNPFYAELAAAIDQELFRRNMTLVTASSVHRPSDAHRTPLESLAEHNVTAVILATQVEPSDLAFARIHNLPIIALNEISPPADLTATLLDHRGATITAVQHLVEHGYRRIGFVGNFDPRDPRYPAWLDALDAAGLPTGPSVDCEWTPEAGYEAGRRLSDPRLTPQAPDALFIASDAIALGCIAGLQEAGLRVPDDVAIVSFDGTTLAPFIGPGLTTMTHPIARIASDAVSVVLDPDAAPGTHLSYQAQLVIRRSCGCAPAH